MPTKTPREIENKLEEIKYNFLNYNWVHTKEYMYDFLVTKPMLALLEEARQEEREKIKEKLQELHRKSESRTSKLECSQDGYEYWLEDSISSL